MEFKLIGGAFGRLAGGNDHRLVRLDEYGMRPILGHAGGNICAGKHGCADRSEQFKTTNNIHLFLSFSIRIFYENSGTYGILSQLLFCVNAKTIFTETAPKKSPARYNGAELFVGLA
jgi:hypothetical protein